MFPEAHLFGSYWDLRWSRAVFLREVMRMIGMVVYCETEDILKNRSIDMKFQKNEGKTDRLVRAGISIVALVGAFFVEEGVVRMILFVVAGAMAVTAAAGFCTLYALFGVSTCPRKETPVSK